MSGSGGRDIMTTLKRIIAVGRGEKLIACRAYKNNYGC